MNFWHRRSTGLPPSGPPELARALEAHVLHLAGTIGERHTRRPHALEQAARYIEAYWTRLGLVPERQTFVADGVPCSNIVVTLAGTSPEEVVVGAHYDSVERCPGANDNGTGVASLLELTRLVLPYRNRRTVRMVAFVNEESPHFEQDTMGSEVYARQARARHTPIHAMICLETMGCYLADPGSQTYPELLTQVTSVPLQTIGNFITVVGNEPSAWLADETARALEEASRFPFECLSVSPAITGVDWSDHASFWRAGFAAVMLTDTAPFRYVQYHTPQDTADHVNFGCLAELTRALGHVLHRLTT